MYMGVDGSNIFSKTKNGVEVISNLSFFSDNISQKHCAAHSAIGNVT